MSYAEPQRQCHNRGVGGPGGVRPPSRSVREPSGPGSVKTAGVPGGSGQVCIPVRSRTPIEIVTVDAVATTTGGDILPVAGDPPEHAPSHTSTWSTVASGPGWAKAASSAQVAGPNPEGIGLEIAGGNCSAETGQVAAGRSVVVPHPDSTVTATSTDTAKFACRFMGSVSVAHCHSLPITSSSFSRSPRPAQRSMSARHAISV